MNMQKSLQSHGHIINSVVLAAGDTYQSEFPLFGSFFPLWSYYTGACCVFCCHM